VSKSTHPTVAANAVEQAESALPQSLTISLGELVGAVKDGLLAFSVGVGLEVLQLLMEEDVTVLAGAKGRHDPARSAVRHGYQEGSVTLGGRRVPVRRPRVRTADGTAELPVATYEHFARTELLGAMALERMLAGLSTRDYRVGLEPVGAQVTERARATSRSAVSRRFVARTQTALAELLAADLSGVNPVAILVDGVSFAEHLCVVGLVIDAEGRKRPVSLREGSTENATLVGDLLVDLRERGLDVTRPILAVLDGAKALVKGVEQVFDQPLVQRCQVHKLRNILDYLPEAERSWVAAVLHRAWREPDADKAERDLKALATRLDKRHPGAAASVREGLAETLTVTRLGVPDKLAKTLRTTNPVESMLAICRQHSSNVKRWRDGQMAMRWCAAGMLEAEGQFRRVKGYKEIPILVAAMDRHFHPQMLVGKGEVA
jgi:transposase-like protein